jgi:rhodanese-related sulfurtransferase
MYRARIAALIVVLAVSFWTSARAADDYPLRAKFPNVQTMSTQQLNAEYDAVLIVDARAKDEYDVIHMTKAILVPVVTREFDARIQDLRQKNATAKIVFYCNGHTCPKSYEAADRAIKAGISNVLAYDAGIFEWTTAQPAKSVFFGQTPVQLKKLISQADLKRRFVDFSAFKASANAAGAMVVDIREPLQRTKVPAVPNLRNIPMDQFVTLLAQKRFADKNLLIMDSVGRQVEWLQYYLEQYGYKNYTFLAGGADAVN